MKLSICIATFSRAAFIGATIEALASQLYEDVELIVVDGASPDNTPEVLERCVERYPGLRYYREYANGGVDRDYDRAVSYATGEFVWLMTDDDLVDPYALKKLVPQLDADTDLVFVNAQIWNADMTKLLQARFVPLSAAAVYEYSDQYKLFEDMGFLSSFIGSIVIRRSVWQARDRSMYYGTLFVHVGVIFQNPPMRRVRFVADPLIKIRYGNAMWTSRSFEIWMFKWPRLVWSFDFPSDAKLSVSPAEPWRQARKLLLYRALGSYTLEEYRQSIRPLAQPAYGAFAKLIAVAPRKLVNAMVAVICIALHRNRLVLYDLSRSNSSTGVSRLAARLIGA